MKDEKTKAIAQRDDVKQIILSLKFGEIDVFSVPEEYRNDFSLIVAERRMGKRVIGYRGYDVINDSFFVEEELISNESTKTETTWFDSFLDYYNYLGGKIYSKACYYKCDFKSKTDMELDIPKLSQTKSFTDKRICDYKYERSNQPPELYAEIESKKERFKEWVNKLNACKTSKSFCRTIKSYKKNSDLGIDVCYLFWKYIFDDIANPKRFENVMEYMLTGEYPEYMMRYSLCHVYNPDDVLEAYAGYSFGAASTQYKHKRELKQYIQKIKTESEEYEVEGYFSEQSHFYIESVYYPSCRDCSYHIFDSFEEFVSYRKGDLRNCDLSKAYDLKCDFSQFITDETTILPIYETDCLAYSVVKEYKNGTYYVTQKWKNENGVCLNSNYHSFDYFFDFVAFLEGDLSGANLLLCDGINNLNDISDLNVSNVLAVSSFYDKHNISYDAICLPLDRINSFALTKDNEQKTGLVLQSARDDYAPQTSRLNYFSISYITDIHLLHKLNHFKAKSESDVLYVVKRIANSMAEANDVLLIGGDISSDFRLFELFIQELDLAIKEHYYKLRVIFVLGNHDLWSFTGCNIKEIVARYRALIEKHGMYFLHNDLLYMEADDLHYSTDGRNMVLKVISQKELESLSSKEIRERLNSSRFAILGGLAFSGYNKEFNANNGIYLGVINRDEEIELSNEFLSLYNKVLQVLPDKNVIIFTHTPLADWNPKPEFHQGYIYVSGHNHRNEFHDDGKIRLFADNQVGYKNNNPTIKQFWFDVSYDYFSDYNDGIYEIAPEEYRKFYSGKCMGLTFTRQTNVLYMLKKKGYYCFIHKSKDKHLSILNGGALKKLQYKDIQYYYDNMDTVIRKIEEPLFKYTEIQEKIAEEVKRIGGSGRIHGCIVDIDFYNHIYVNPIDLKITGYWAYDIIDKFVYPNIPALLKENCPEIYAKYNTLLGSEEKNALCIYVDESKEVTIPPQIYFDTDIYKASRVINKMQRLQDHILSVWVESEFETNEFIATSKH